LHLANWEHDMGLKKLGSWLKKNIKPIAAVAAVVFPPLAPAIGTALGATGTAAAIVGSAALGAGASAIAGDSTQDILKSAAIGGAAAGVTQAVAPNFFQGSGLLGSATAPAAPAATGEVATGLMGSALPSAAGTGVSAAATGTGIMDSLAKYGTGVLDFAKQNPQLAGSLLGALGGAVSAANAPKETTTTTSIDPAIKAEYLANLERAKSTAANLGPREFAQPGAMYTEAERNLYNLGMTPFGAADIMEFYNPFEEQVVQGALGDIERSRQMQDVADRARAVQARAFGGSRQGVQSALTNEAALRQAGTTAAGLRQAGFSQAAQFGQSDAARQLQAQMANQGVSLTLEQANAQLRQQAALANQQAGISGAGLRQSAINQLGNLGAQQQNLGMTGANAVMLAQMERQKLEQQRLDAMRNLPLERLGITGGALGLQPANTGGTTSQPLYTSTLGSALSGGLTGSYIGSLLQPKKA
jgi:hypothetical protein